MFIVSFIVALIINVTLFSSFHFTLGLWDYLIVIVACPLLFVCHEGIHALSFIIGGAPKRSISFGAIPKKFMLYCTTCEPISKKTYMISLLMPLIITGIIPIIIATILLDYKYILLFALMISGAAGDVVMIGKLLKFKKAKMILDHPKAPAFYLLYDENEIPEDFVEVTDAMEQEILKQINSK